jgi:hypothetical protein
MLTRTKVSNRINLNVNSLKYILIQNKTFSLPAAFGGLFFTRILKKDLTPPPARLVLKANFYPLLKSPLNPPEGDLKKKFGNIS